MENAIVAPQIQHGHWIEWHNTTTDYGVKCSCCDSFALDCDGWFMKTPYCPFCGAKMEGATE